WNTMAYDGEIMYSRLLFDRFLLTGGYQYSQEDIDDKGKDYKADQHLHSFYLQSEINLHPVVFVVGARVDDHNQWGTEINPKGSILVKITKDLKLRGSIGTAFKSPSLAKLYADSWRMGPYLVHANPDLKPEKSIGYQVGVEYTFQERHLAKVSIFRNDVEDMIVSRIVRTPPPPYDMYWENVDEAYTQGVEVSLTSRLTDTLTAQAGYTYLETRNKKLDKELTLRPKHKGTVELNQRIPDFGVNLNITGMYVGKRIDSDDLELAGYDLWNVAVTKDLGKNVQLFARADNIFGKQDVVDEYDLDGARFMFGAKLNF
ncbi:MAG: TonB-dependent receptor, partial [Smithellaceae bacterium]